MEPTSSWILVGFVTTETKQELRHHCLWPAPPWPLHPRPSLISNCVNLSFGTRGRSWRLNGACFLHTRNGGGRRALEPRSPAGSCSVPVILLTPKPPPLGGHHQVSRGTHLCCHKHSFPAPHGETTGFLSVAALEALQPPWDHQPDAGAGTWVPSVLTCGR